MQVLLNNNAKHWAGILRKFYLVAHLMELNVMFKMILNGTLVLIMEIVIVLIPGQRKTK